MKVLCDLKSFSKALTAVRRIAIKNSTVPSLSMVRISLTAVEQFLRLACYDTQTYVIQDIGCEASTAFDPILVIAQDLHDFVKTFKTGTLEFDIGPGSYLMASVGSASVTLDVFRESEYSWPKPTDRLPNVGEIEWKDFATLLSQSTFAASTDDSKSETLKSTYFDSCFDGKISLVCTDGEVMAISSLVGGPCECFTALISQTASDALEKFFSPKDVVAIGQADGMMEFVSGTAVFQTKLVRGHFPDYQKAVPSTYSGGLRVLTKALIEKLTFLKPCSTIRLTTDMNVLTAAGTAEDKVFSSSLEVEKAKGGDLLSELPSKPLLTILSKIKDEKVVFKWSSDRSILRIYPSGRDSEQTYLIKYGEVNAST